jgi:hypothetical protein
MRFRSSLIFSGPKRGCMRLHGRCLRRAWWGCSSSAFPRSHPDLWLVTSPTDVPDQERDGFSIGTSSNTCCSASTPLETDCELGWGANARLPRCSQEILETQRPIEVDVCWNSISLRRTRTCECRDGQLHEFICIVAAILDKSSPKLSVNCLLRSSPPQYIGTAS